LIISVNSISLKAVSDALYPSLQNQSISLLLYARGLLL